MKDRSLLPNIGAAVFSVCSSCADSTLTIIDKDMARTVKIPEKILTSVFSTGNKDDLGALAVWLLLKSYYVDSKYHNFTTKSFCKTFHVGKICAKRYISAGKKMGLLSTIKRETEERCLQELDDKGRYKNIGRKRAREIKRFGKSKINKNHSVIEDLVAIRKRYAGNFIKFSVMDNDESIGGKTIYIPSSITDAETLIKKGSKCQGLSQVIDLLKLAYVIFLNNDRPMSSDGGSTNTPIRKVDASKFNSESAKSTTVCENQGVNLYERLTMERIFKKNVGTTCNTILNRTNTTLITESSLRRILKVGQGMGVIWCNENYSCVRDFSELEEQLKESEKTTTAKYDPAKGLNALIAYIDKANCEYESKRLDVYEKKQESLDIHFADGHSINLNDDKIGWYGRSESDANKFFVRLANNYINCCYLLGSSMKNTCNCTTGSKTHFSKGFANAEVFPQRRIMESTKTAKKDSQGLDDSHRPFA